MRVKRWGGTACVGDAFGTDVPGMRVASVIDTWSLLHQRGADEVCALLQQYDTYRPVFSW
ncbi:hypothetical protein GCM10010207_22880 [Streptomyces atratus]|nr:hypothetical protein GCM10010207_22880 [Streptomyces atratus]